MNMRLALALTALMPVVAAAGQYPVLFDQYNNAVVEVADLGQVGTAQHSLTGIVDLAGEPPEVGLGWATYSNLGDYARLAAGGDGAWVTLGCAGPAGGSSFTAHCINPSGGTFDLSYSTTPPSAASSGFDPTN